MKLTVKPVETSASFGMATVTVGSSVSAMRDQARTVPFVIPREDEFYWTMGWQEGERRALIDLQEGRSRSFTNPLDAIRWLLSEDD